MIGDYNYDEIREPAEIDPPGTIRVCQQFGTIAVYIKMDEGQWITVYLDPYRGEKLIPTYPVSNAVACSHPVVFVPKAVV